MKELVCRNKTNGISSPFMATDCLEKFSRGLTSPDSVSEKFTQVEQTPLIKRQVVWGNHTEQMTEKQNSVKITPAP